MASNKVDRYFCGHCEQVLTKTLFFKHKRMYYDRAKSVWRKERVRKFQGSDYHLDITGRLLVSDVCIVSN